MVMTVQEALKQVLADIEAMSPEQLREELEKHRDGDLTHAFKELHDFGVFLTENGYLNPEV